jgi:hypothetical protein
VKKLAAIACICTALAASSAAALTLREMSGSIDACHTQGQVDDIVTALSNEGWQLSSRPLSDTTTAQLVWPQAMFYLAGDTGGEELTSIVALQTKTIAGFARKQDIPSSKTRIMIRAKGNAQDSVLLLWQMPVAGSVSVVCRFALSANSLNDNHAQAISANPPIETGENQGFSITSMNTSVLSTALGRPVTTSGVLSTHNRFALGATQ